MARDLINIDELSEAELVDLNHRVVARLRFLHEMHAHADMLEYRIGERVEFDSGRGGSRVGVLTKYNKKTVTVVTDTGEHWNVAPCHLRSVENHGTHQRIDPKRIDHQNT
ncbi:hypothetical protein [Bythopirellula goksoeyrii]|uniref:KOW domain-containing protein n=1 Tax=Bythopirellula goksoeyrii TaxID=1400387 RepID=A0A5B9QDV8_9BACT|nr:hypothetical protein [Bythopirellula goksoeyrii]QEG35692.1 hypothetical protein Pr1d_29940 [Bythopirellula goksoeyrii]